VGTTHTKYTSLTFQPPLYVSECRPAGPRAFRLLGAFQRAPNERESFVVKDRAAGVAVRANHKPLLIPGVVDQE